MLEGLINNGDSTDTSLFHLNSRQLYIMAKTEDKNLGTYISQYKNDYKLSQIDVYVNLALIHGQLN